MVEEANGLVEDAADIVAISITGEGPLDTFVSKALKLLPSQVSTPDIYFAPYTHRFRIGLQAESSGPRVMTAT